MLLRRDVNKGQKSFSFVNIFTPLLSTPTVVNECHTDLQLALNARKFIIIRRSSFLANVKVLLIFRNILFREMNFLGFGF